MGNPNRAALLTKAQKVLKQHYKPVSPTNRPLLEQLLFASCLENTSFDTAEKVYARIVESFFDWNEVRVSTVNELSEVMRGLPDPTAAASTLKRVLQGVFESTYSFDLESIKKEKIGQGVTRLEGIDGVTPFMIAYVTQTTLGGHAIPLDRGSADSLLILGILSEEEAQPGSVAALERAIPKNKGIEFGSMIHQLGADYTASPNSQNVRGIFTAINPDAKDRFPKRTAKKETPKPDAAAPEAPAATTEASKTKAPPAAAKKAPSAKKESKAEPPAPPKKAPSAKSPPEKTGPVKKSSSKQLTKRKPR